jgi:hypothetical protein
LFEFTDAVGCFLRVKLRHAPVVEEFSSAHGVAEVGAPVVGLIYIAHGGGDAAFSHDRMRFTKKRFANEADTRALRKSFECGTKTGPACADDEYIVFVSFVI